MKKFITPVLIAVALAAASLSTPAASFAAAPKAPPAQTPIMAQLRVINASPDAPPMDVYVNGELISRRVAYGGVTGYNMIDPGDARVQMVRAFIPLGLATPFVDASFKLERDKAYTLALSGMSDQIKPLLYTDEYDGPGKGLARIRMLNLSPNAPAVDVVGVPIGSTETITPVKNLAYTKASAYVTMKSGEWNFAIKPTGALTSLIQLDETAVPEGQTISVFLIGVVNGRPKLETDSAVDGTATPSQLRFLNASPDAPALDLYLDGNSQLNKVGYQDISNYIDVLEGEYQIQVVPSGETPAKGTTLIETTLKVEKGKVYALAAGGMLASIKPYFAVDDGDVPREESRGLMRTWHLSPDTPAVTAVLPEMKNAVLAKDLSFGNASDYMEVIAGDDTNEVQFQIGSTTVLTSFVVVPTSGVVTVYVFGLSKGTPALESVVGRDR